jgi:GNAT superfamily N-acetyltransferase
MHIFWKIERLDEFADQYPAESECLLQIEGAIECDGQAAGLVDAFYLFHEDPASPDAFMELWDLDRRTCEVFEEISSPHHGEFRDPLPDFLGAFPGILCVQFIALRPQFRRRGLGRKVMGEVVQNFADSRVEVVLLKAQPLQHLPHGYDHFGEEIHDLPWNSPEEDLARLMTHFRSWGMQDLPGTRYLLAAPEVFDRDLTADWFPSLLSDR